MSFFPRERYQLKSDADWVGERGSSRYVEPKFDSAFRHRTSVRKFGQPASPATEAHLVSHTGAYGSVLLAEVFPPTPN